MRLLGASLVLTCGGEADGVLRDGGILIDDGRIKSVGDFRALKEQYGHCDSVFYKDHIILPAFINSHIHFEFSRASTKLNYGSFALWLDSVMKHRDSIFQDSDNDIKQEVLLQKKCGVGTVCAISSYDNDLDLLLKSNLRVIFCHEVLGANSDDFENQVLSISSRLERSLGLRSSLFQPGLAIHSPYSVHPRLASYVIDLATKYNLLVSTHFLESKEECEWLESKSGYFASFYEKTIQLSTPPHFSKADFLSLFEGVRAIFAHCLYADSDFKHEILKRGHIVSAPRSNLLLNGKMGDNEIISTDSRGSNSNTNILDELRCALFSTIAHAGHSNSCDLESISRSMLQAITSRPAKALGLNNGMLEEGRDADIAVFGFDCDDVSQIATNFILRASEATALFVNGVDILHA